MKKIISSTLVIIGFVLGATALSTFAAWTTPTCNPATDPGECNVAAPINIGNSAQIKAGSLTLNSASIIDDIGLTITGKIKLDDLRKGAGKVLTDVAGDGVGTWEVSPAQGYEMACLSWLAGVANDRCCRLNKANGEISCKTGTSPDGYASSFGYENTPFSASTLSTYSMVLMDGIGTARTPILCRVNGANGTAQCKSSAAYYQVVAPWTNTVASPF